MADKNSILRFLVKVDRLASWLLLVLMIMFFVTGFSMTGEYGLNRLFSVRDALAIHTSLAEAVMVLLAYHVAVRGYLELKRLRIFRR